MSDPQEQIAESLYRNGVGDRELAEGLARILVTDLGLIRHEGAIMVPNATEFWHTWAMPWVRTCICVPDNHDILNGGLRDDCPIHGDRV